MAGSLQAGLSLAQSLDTVVREGQDPLAGEFRRALVETRLGVAIEDALESIGERMQSVDFEWIVMAIRIQREVGGNLAELLNKVAETIREREYLGGRSRPCPPRAGSRCGSCWRCRPRFIAYMSVTNPSTCSPLFTPPLGYVMLGVMVDPDGCSASSG